MLQNWLEQGCAGRGRAHVQADEWGHCLDREPCRGAENLYADQVGHLLARKNWTEAHIARGKRIEEKSAKKMETACHEHDLCLLERQLAGEIGVEVGGWQGNAI